MTCTLTAYRVADATGWTLTPAAGKREWMDGTPEKFAYRCLPLVMANQVGWNVGCPVNLSLNWNGKSDIHSVAIRFPDGDHSGNRFVASHFGSGIVTFSLPWLFRTSPGYGVWARGPVNSPKENVSPLEGIIETDWAPYTFTMNWKMMKRNTEVFFRKGEPVCTLVPFPLALPEAVEPVLAEIDENERLKYDFYQFTSRRSGNIDTLKRTGESVFSMDYMKGQQPDGSAVPEHRKAFRLKEFEKGRPGGADPAGLRLPPGAGAGPSGG